MQNRKSKAAKRDKAYGTLAAFPEFIRQFAPPTGEFDPRGAWKQSYTIQFFDPKSDTPGFLEVERQPEGDKVTLTVATRLAHENGFHEENARLVCAADKLGTLRSFRLESISGDVDGKPVAETKALLRGEVRGTSIEWTWGGGKRVAAAPPLVANWALFDAVQRLGPDEKPIEFTLLDDGDVLKPAQRLVYVGRTSVEVAGGANLPLHCWEQTGYGVLPAHYWVDGKSRLLFAIAGQKAFLYDPDARNHAASHGKGGKKA